MQEQINQTQGKTPSPNVAAALLTGAALIGGAALHAQAKSTRAVSPAITFAQIPGTGDVKVLNYASHWKRLKLTCTYRQLLSWLL